MASVNISNLPINGYDLIDMTPPTSGEGERCTICQEEINIENEIYEPTLHKLEECGHYFHIGCIIQWFRAGNSNCPNCGDHGLNGNQSRKSIYWAMSDSNNERKSRYKMIRRYANSKNAPTKLKRALEKLVNMEKQEKEMKKLHKELKSGDQKFTLQESKKLLSKIRRDRYYMHRKVAALKYDISAFPIIPIIIPKIKYITRENPINKVIEAPQENEVINEPHIPELPPPPSPHSDYDIEDNVVNELENAN